MYNKSTTKKTVECPVCRAAGNADYIGHWVRDDRGKVVCPTLLNQKCDSCGCKGHTPKYCVVLKREVRIAKRSDYEQTAPKKKQSKNTKKKNAFDLLCVDSDSEAEEPKKSVAKLSPRPSSKRWADVVSKPEPKKTEPKKPEPKKTEPKKQDNTVIRVAAKKMPMRWSEMLSDSESDED